MLQRFFRWILRIKPHSATVDPVERGILIDDAELVSWQEIKKLVVYTNYSPAYSPVLLPDIFEVVTLSGRRIRFQDYSPKRIQEATIARVPLKKHPHRSFWTGAYTFEREPW